MLPEVLTRRRWLLRAHGQHIVVVRGTRERFTHPLMKALLWALYLPQYPNSSIEIHIGDRYKPDVIAYPPGEPLRAGTPVFWGEAGQVGAPKIESLARRYRATHFAIAKWDTRLDPFERIVRRAVQDVPRRAPFDLISFPADSAGRFVDADGHIHITHDDLIWLRVE